MDPQNPQQCCPAVRRSTGLTGYVHDRRVDTGWGDGGAVRAQAAIPYGQVVTSPERLTPDEISAIESYVLHGHERINRALRGDIEMTAALASSVERLRSALRKYPLSERAHVTRGVARRAVPTFDPDDPGGIDSQVFEFDEFLSASMKSVPPPMSGEGLIIDLLVPVGTPAFAVGALAEFPLERELLVIDARKVLFIGAEFDEDQRKWRLYGVVLKEVAADERVD